MEFLLSPMGIILLGALLVVLLVIWLFNAMWRVAEPNEALLISGLGARGKHDAAQESLGFKIVSGKGTLVIPGLQKVRRFTLDLREAFLEIECVTTQGIPLGLRGVLIFKVGDDYSSIANAARRFLDQQQDMNSRVQAIFEGHLRSIVGNMTVEEMIRDREKLSQLTRESSGTDMEKLGLIIDSLQIQEIHDPTGYITNLGKPQAAVVDRDARIAQAQADREATEREQEALALKAEAIRNSEIKKAGYQAEVDQASSLAQQAGPLADAKARQDVVVEETRVAELEAQREEQRLQTQVRKPADAKAYEQVTLARAARDAQIADSEGDARKVELDAKAQADRVKLMAAADAERVRLEAAANAEQVQLTGEAEARATKVKGLAEGEAVRAKGLAEAEAIKASADALAENQDAVIGQQLAENWPAIVEAAAKPFGAIDNLTVLNGAQGMSDALAQALSQGVAGLQLARDLLGNGARQNGHAEASLAASAVRPRRAPGGGAAGSALKDRE